MKNKSKLITFKTNKQRNKIKVNTCNKANKINTHKTWHEQKPQQ